jgi:hypothetical protein
LRKIVYGKLLTATATVAPVPAAPTAIGPVIPDNMVRRITRVSIQPNAGGAQLVELAQGHAAAPLARILQDFWAAPGLPPSMWGQPEPTMPLFIARPVTSVFPAATQQNQIYALGTIALLPVEVTIEYWDQRG